MIVLPIVDRELRARARRPWTHWSRLLLGLGAAGVAMTFLMVEAVGPQGLRLRWGGAQLFGSLSLMAFLLCAGAGIFMTADELSGEKREGTLGFLFLTDLRGLDVVLGKLVASSVTAVCGLLAMFPVFAITLTMGGVSGGEFTRMMAGLASTLLLSLAIGLFVSSVSRESVRAMVGSGVMIGGLVVLAPALDGLVRAAGHPGPTPLAWVSPWSLFSSAFDGTYRSASGAYVGALLGVHLLTWVFLGLASWLLPRRWQETGTAVRPVTPTSVSTLADDGGGTEARGRRIPRRRLGDQNPVYWLASRRGSPAFPILMTLLIALAGVGVMVIGEPELIWMVGNVAGIGFGLVIRVSVAVQAARSFAEPRRSGALELVLTTPLRTREILGGFWKNLRRMYILPIAAWCVLWLLITGASHGSGPWRSWEGIFSSWGASAALVGYPILNFLADCLAAAWVGMLVGLTTRRPGMAPGLTVLYVVVTPWLLFCLPRLLLTIPLAFWARDRVLSELRALGAPR